MGGAKPAVSSITIISVVVMLIAAGAQLVGYTVSADDQAAAVNLIQNGLTVWANIVAFIAGAAAIWGRIRATKQISGVVSTR